MTSVLVDGCFDPLHPGHARYLTAARDIARSLGASLVCKVAPDDHVSLKHVPLLTQQDRAELVSVYVDRVIADTESVPDAIRRLRPAAYVKGCDWRDQLPADHVEACREVGCNIVYTDSVVTHSTEILTTWRQDDDRRALERFEAVVKAQPHINGETFTPAYFARQGFTFEARAEREGRHPALVRDVLAPIKALDYGCGPGHFVRMLRESGVSAYGYDPYVDQFSAPYPDRAFDTVICREVLEHVPIRQYGHIVSDLVRLSTRTVYVTARFNLVPRHLFDVQTADDLDPTHISRSHPAWLRSLFLAHGLTRRPDLESALDHQHQGRVLVYAH